MPNKVIRRIKAEAIWVDPEDKKKFENIRFGLMGDTKENQTQESTFKFLLNEFFKSKGGKNYAIIGSSKH